MMKPKLISRLPRYDKWLIGLGIFSAIFFPVVAIQRHEWDNWILLFEAGIIAIFAFCAWERKNAAHPVLFDKKHIYYAQKRTDYIVPLVKIESIRISMVGTTFYCIVKYTSMEGKTKRFFFYSNDWSLKFIQGPIKQLEYIIRIQQPEFKMKIQWPYDII